MSASLELVLAGLAVWRVTHLLHAEDGPWDALAKLRQRAAHGFWGNLLDCFYCLSLWVAAAFTLCLADAWRRGLLLWPALSGAAILLERATGGLGTPPVAPYVEDEDEREKERVDGML